MFLRCGGEIAPFSLEIAPFSLEIAPFPLEMTGKFLEIDYLSLVLGPPPTRRNENNPLLYFTVEYTTGS